MGTGFAHARQSSERGAVDRLLPPAATQAIVPEPVKYISVHAAGKHPRPSPAILHELDLRSADGVGSSPAGASNAHSAGQLDPKAIGRGAGANPGDAVEEQVPVQ